MKRAGAALRPRGVSTGRANSGAASARRGPAAPKEWLALLKTRPAWEAKQAEALRCAVADAFPGAIEAYKAGWRAVTFADESVGFVCGVFIRPGGPSLYFENGAALEDPDALLTRRMSRTAAADFPQGTRVRVKAIRAMLARSIALASVGRKRSRGDGGRRNRQSQS